MKALTVRNIPADVSRTIEQRATREGISLSRALIAILEEATGAKRTGVAKRLHHELDGLCGIWSAEEASAIENAIAQQRTIDPELWK
jgi:hypothetical protein